MTAYNGELRCENDWKPTGRWGWKNPHTMMAEFRVEIDVYKHETPKTYSVDVWVPEDKIHYTQTYEPQIFGEKVI